tara:strand:+ start:1585 stop:3285 length:1701 start_codon:yes stop_codon:yes gene_type:complete
MSQLQVDGITNTHGDGAPNFPQGLTGTTANFSGNVSVAGTLTYEDVTNIDSVGLITARSGIEITGNIGLGGSTYGTAGQILTSGGSGANATWSDLVSGGSAEGVAGLNIANGAAVAVASTDGKFYPVTGTNEVFGTSAEFTSDTISYPSVIYDTANSRVIVVWQGWSDDDGYALVGTISGTTISWGSNQKWNGTTNSRPNRITYDSVNEKIVIAFKQDDGTIRAVVGTVSGSTISWGTIASVYSGANGRNPDISFDSSTGKVVIVYKKNDTAKAYCRVGTVSGTDITFGTEVISLDTTVEQLSIACNGGYVVVVSEEHVNVGQISGTDITFGTMGTIPYSDGATGSNIPSVDIVVDPNTDVWAISAARNSKLEFFGATRSGTTLSFGTGLVFDKATACNHSLAWTGSENRFFQTFVSGTSASDGMQSAIVEVYGNNAVLRSAPRQFKSDTNGTDQYDQTDCCLTVDGKMVVAFQYTTGASHGWYYVEQTRVSNGTKGGFVGMSQAAYSAGQTAKVSITGSVSTNQTGLSTASPYYLNGDGTLAQGIPDSEDLFVGNAISGTSLALK